jgi:hypothetical protein
MNSGLTRRCRFTRRKRSLLSEQGKTKPDACGEVQDGIEVVDLGFPRPEVRRGRPIWLSDSG